MLSYNDALSQILVHARTCEPILLETAKANGYVLSVDVHAPIALPPFDNSAVDGFGLRADAIAKATPQEPMALSVQYLVAAGDAPVSLRTGMTCRIMTGALVPEGVDAIVMQENVRHEGDFAIFDRAALLGQNIRKAGEDVECGELIFRAGRILSPKEIGLLCALGIHEVEVYRKPRVAIVSTGSELVTPGEPLQPGQVYYCTGQMLAAVCTEMGASVEVVERVHDDEEVTKAAVARNLGADVVLVTGGMSVGEHDYARRAFDVVGAQAVFHRGKWRPGKPLYFGLYERNDEALSPSFLKEGRGGFLFDRPSEIPLNPPLGKGETLILGIPGNPVACFVMAQIFLAPLLAQMQGRSPALPWRSGILKHLTTKKSDFTLFARGHVDESGQITLLETQGSHELGKLAQANALCLLQEEWETCPAGQSVQYLAI